MITASAPGKAIIFGEHAVVYGRPAVAVPLHDIRAHVTIEDGPWGQGIRIIAPDISQEFILAEAGADNALALVMRLTLQKFASNLVADLTITVRSEVPVARGLGSGAAVSVALARAVAAHFRADVSSSFISEVTFEAEKLHHGTPSGIDNAVVAYECPIFFIRNKDPEPFPLGRPIMLVIGDTGERGSTRTVVEDVRQAWQQQRECYERLFDSIGEVSRAGRAALEAGQQNQVGMLMDQNQLLLQELGVSSSKLEELIAKARLAGALGAKLSGAGRGGVMLALVTQESAACVAEALANAGAAGVYWTQIAPSPLVSSCAQKPRERGM